MDLGVIHNSSVAQSRLSQLLHKRATQVCAQCTKNVCVISFEILGSKVLKFRYACCKSIDEALSKRVVFLVSRMLTALPTGKESWALGCLGCVLVRFYLGILGDAVAGKSKARRTCGSRFRVISSNVSI